LQLSVLQMTPVHVMPHGTCSCPCFKWRPFTWCPMALAVVRASNDARSHDAPWHLQLSVLQMTPVHMMPHGICSCPCFKWRLFTDGSAIRRASHSSSLIATSCPCQSLSLVYDFYVLFVLSTYFQRRLRRSFEISLDLGLGKRGKQASWSNNIDIIIRKTAWFFAWWVIRFWLLWS